MQGLSFAYEATWEAKIKNARIDLECKDGCKRLPVPKTGDECKDGSKRLPMPKTGDECKDGSKRLPTPKTGEGCKDGSKRLPTPCLGEEYKDGSKRLLPKKRKHNKAFVGGVRIAAGALWRPAGGAKPWENCKVCGQRNVLSGTVHLCV